MLRDLTEQERDFIGEVAQLLDPSARDALLADLRNVRAESTLSDHSLIRFHIDGYSRAEYVGQHAYPIEASMKDQDGATVGVLLYADPNNRLFELEFLRWADGPLLNPDWASIKVELVDTGDRRKDEP
ncbi:DUF6984 family protein [Paraburkholderia saeva]|uniref:DUF6984 family protein n=1 Tax=Paraburkholderia saeva TaxID=2777537 RepID=UPI001E51AB05|nr:hypothetical protein [Paraburkholderia saeva]